MAKIEISHAVFEVEDQEMLFEDGTVDHVALTNALQDLVGGSGLGHFTKIVARATEG